MGQLSPQQRAAQLHDLSLLVEQLAFWGVRCEQVDERFWRFLQRERVIGEYDMETRCARIGAHPLRRCASIARLQRRITAYLTANSSTESLDGG